MTNISFKLAFPIIEIRYFQICGTVIKLQIVAVRITKAVI